MFIVNPAGFRDINAIGKMSNTFTDLVTLFPSHN